MRDGLNLAIAFNSLKIVVGVAVRPSPLISCDVTRAILDSAVSESQKGNRRGPRGFPMSLVVVFCLLGVSSLSGDIDQIIYEIKFCSLEVQQKHAPF